MRKTSVIVAVSVVLGLLAGSLVAEDNVLTPQEKAEGWQLLFNGKDYTGWMCNNGKPVQSPIEEHAIMPHKSGGYLVVYKKPFKDFILKCDVKMSPHCNSGIFFRVSDLKDPVQSGFEVQILDQAGVGYHEFGAIYDLAHPIKPAKLKPTGQWNTVVLTCCGPKISVEVNGELICQMNCDDFTEVGKRPDGTRHKFSKRGIPIKDFAREGYIGFQDHGHKVWFKNIKIKVLKNCE